MTSDRTGLESSMAKNIIRIGLLDRLLQNLKLLFPLIKDYWKGNYRDVSALSNLLGHPCIL